MTEKISLTVRIPAELAGLRFDQALAKLFPDYSRVQLKDWIIQQEVTLDSRHVKPNTLILGGEQVVIHAQLKVQPVWQAQDIALDIIYEDDTLLVINKPAGMVVHPAAGNPDNTLLNALLHHAPTLQNVPRAGIIHRLDKDTTGILVIAKTPAAHTHLVAQLKIRQVEREYQAIVIGKIISGGKVDAPLGRHPKLRKRMTVIDSGKPAITHYRVSEHYRAHTRLKVNLETGRTHQIRVHMAYIHHPVFGDATYGPRLQIPPNATPELIEQMRSFKRQALHAYKLGLIHPATGKPMRWTAPIPEDMRQLIQALREDTQSQNGDSDYYDDDFIEAP